jgi:glycerol uptake facilitator-like aquaporin
MMPSFDQLIFWLGLVVLGLNVVGLLTLLLARPARERRGAGVVSQARACAAELLGAFALVFFSMLAAAGGREPGSALSCALAHGMTLSVCIAGLGALSGGHFNPAVTLGYACAGRLRPLLGIGYLLAQIAGASAAASLLHWLLGGSALARAIPAMDQEIVPLRAAFVLEAAATFVVVLVVFGTAVAPRGPRALAPWAIGASVTAAMLAVGPLTGAALNPARFLGPALVAGRLDAWLVYTAGPALGALLAAVCMHFYLAEPAAEEPPAEAPPAREYRPGKAA